MMGSSPVRYGQYMAAWDRVNLVPDEVRLEDLVNSVKSVIVKCLCG